MKSSDKKFFRLVLVLVMTALAFRLLSVWLNIERTELAYDIRQLEEWLKEDSERLTKLEVDRDNRLSPRELSLMAEKLGLGPARIGQIRVLDNTTGISANTTRENVDNGTTAQ